MGVRRAQTITFITFHCLLGAGKWTKENPDFAVLCVLFLCFGVSEIIGAVFERLKFVVFKWEINIL